MSGGQYVGSQATQGFGTSRFGDQGINYLNPSTAGANIYPGGGSPYGGYPGNPNRTVYGPEGGLYAGRGNPGADSGGGSDSPTGGPVGGGQPGGGGYQFGGGGGGQGYGGYSAMQPYQFGSQGAQGDLNATGGAAYGGYSGLANAYGRLGSQGVTGAERANLMSASNEAIQSNANAYRDQIMNRAAASGNTAGTAGALARLGASSGQALVGADRQNQIAIMQENQRRKEAGLAGQMGAAQGQAGLYGTGAGYTSNLLAGRARLASLKKEGYTEGAGTGGTVSGSYSGG
jgi:hypothetical protein